MTTGPQDLAADLNTPRLIWVGRDVEVHSAQGYGGTYFEIIIPADTGTSPLALVAALNRLPETARLRDAFNTGDDISFNFWNAA
ncbi:hypothetical protein GCM10022419_015670 [Nonomuraea rosea]|uniref:Uncharacterized protein n=1 Tax=Nonomuraea rosea TaxID=638574 RepID=A0ABP6VMB7_9ACTN